MPHMLIQHRNIPDKTDHVIFHLKKTRCDKLKQKIKVKIKLENGKWHQTKKKYYFVSYSQKKYFLQKKIKDYFHHQQNYSRIISQKSPYCANVTVFSNIWLFLALQTISYLFPQENLREEEFSFFYIPNINFPAPNIHLPFSQQNFFVQQTSKQFNRSHWNENLKN